MRIWPFKTKAVNVSVPLTPAVWSKLEEVFPPENWEQAALLIQHKCGNNLPLMRSGQPDTYDRIRFAVVKLSKGSLEALEEAIGAAQVDWRDVLLAAGFGYDCHAHLQWNPEADGAGVRADRAENIRKPHVVDDTRSVER